MDIASRISLENLGRIHLTFKAVAIYLGAKEFNELFRTDHMKGAERRGDGGFLFRGVPVYPVALYQHFKVVYEPIQPSLCP